MALQKQIIPVVMGTGIDSSADPKITSQGLLLLENGVVDHRGEITKRTGLKSAGNSNTARFLTKFRDKPVIFDVAAWIYQGATPTNTDAFSSIGNVPLFEHSEDKIAGTAQMRREGGDYEEIGNVAIFTEFRATYTGSTYVYKYHLVTISKNDNIVIDEEIHDYCVRLIKIGTTLYIFYIDPTAKKIYQKQMTSADAGVIPAAGDVIPDCEVTEDTLAPISYQFQVCLVRSAGTAIGIIHKIDAVDKYQIMAWKPATNATAEDEFTVDAGGAHTCFNIWHHADNVGLAVFANTVSQKLFVVKFDEDLTWVADEIYDWTPATGNPANVIGYPISANEVQIVWTDVSLASGWTPNDVAIMRVTYNVTTRAVGTPEIVMPGVRIVSRPFYCVATGDYQFLTVLSPDAQDDDHTSFFLVTSSGEIRGRILGAYAEQPFINSYVRSVFRNSDNNWTFLAQKVLNDDRESTADFEVSLSRITINRITGVPKPVECIDHLAFPGSCPKMFDGRSIVEQGFVSCPYDLKLTRSDTGSPTSIGEGKYGYIAIYYWYDANGKRHVSGISATGEIETTTANDKVTILVATLGMTEKDDVWIEIYRTAVDGSLYYKLTSAPYKNSKSVRSISLEDTAGDSSITANEMLYITGNILEDRAPPPYTISCAHQNRLFVVDMEESGAIWYSKEMGPTKGIAFNPFLTIRCDAVEKTITALVSMIDRLLIFYQNQIWATHGSALDDTGSGQGYSIPYLVSESIGCVNQNTIVRVPQGLIFESATGLWLLDKTFQLSPIGDRVKQQYSGVSICKAVEVPQKHRVMWLSSDGNALVYDHKHDMWSTFTNHKCTDAIEVMGVLWIRPVLRNDVLFEDRTEYHDGPLGDIVLKIRTGWYSFAQPMGVMRVYRAILFGQNRSIHTLRIKTAYDMDPVWVDNQTFLSGGLAYYGELADHYGSGLATAYGDKAYLVDVATSRQKVTAIMLEISDEASPSQDLDQGFSLSGLSFEIGLKTGLKRQGTARRFGG